MWCNRCQKDVQESYADNLCISAGCLARRLMRERGEEVIARTASEMPVPVLPVPDVEIQSTPAPSESVQDTFSGGGGSTDGGGASSDY